MAVGQELATDEAGLAQRAVAGDGDAFAELYTRYEKRTYNLCLRIVGSEDEAADATQEAFVSVLRRLPKLEGRDLAFGSYVFTSARHACYDLIERRKRAEPSDEIAEGAIPVGGGVGGGGMGFDPGDPEDDPERNVLLDARQEEIREANLQLPERQREVLVLRELEQLSYDEIADIMEMNRNSVAQLISRARINLRDALRGTALASIATSSADCERAIALLAADQDREPAEDDALAALPHRRLRDLPAQPRGDGGGRGLLSRMAAGGRRSGALPRDHGAGRRSGWRGLERRRRAARGKARQRSRPGAGRPARLGRRRCGGRRGRQRPRAPEPRCCATGAATSRSSPAWQPSSCWCSWPPAFRTAPRWRTCSPPPRTPRR